VENSKDIALIESTKEYHGRYFVLGKLLSPLDGIGPNEIRIPELLAFITKNSFSEIIIAISPSTEGETTIHLIADRIADKSIVISRLSTGIPYGGEMEYTGSTTLQNALKRRFPV
jgi:recombination protein RecR